MQLKPGPRLAWALLAAAVFGLACGEAPGAPAEQRAARKYLELEDLNGAGPSGYASGEELIEGPEESARSSRPRKLARRSAAVEARPSRQSGTKKPRPGLLWTLARVTFEVRSRPAALRPFTAARSLSPRLARRRKIVKFSSSAARARKSRLPRPLSRFLIATFRERPAAGGGAADRNGAFASRIFHARLF